MSLESLLPSYSDLGNISLFVLLVVAALFYFGKLITSVKIQQFEKDDYYIQGFLFCFFYIVIPFFVVLVVSELLSRYIPSLPSGLTNLIVLGTILVQIVAAFLLIGVLMFNFRRFTLFSQWRLAYKKIFEEQKKTSSILKSAEETSRKLNKPDLEETSFNMQVRLADSTCNTVTIFIISLLLLWSAYTTYVHPPSNFLLSPGTTSILVYIFTFLNFTFLSLAFGYVGLYPPPATIYLDNGEEVNGKIIKMGEYIYVAKEDEKKILFINSSKVVKIEESMFKEGAKPQTEEAVETATVTDKKQANDSKN